MPQPAKRSVNSILFRRHLACAVHQFLAALGHGLARPRHRVGQVVVGNPGGGTGA